MTDDTPPDTPSASPPAAPERAAPKPGGARPATIKRGDLLPRNAQPVAAAVEPDAARAAPRPERQAAFQRGLSAESRAAAYLVARGYRILARRWRCPRGEIDIVAHHRSTLVFVEVKARPTLTAAAEAVTRRQQSRLVGAGEAWLALFPDPRWRDIRFDAILVAPDAPPQHLESAFDASV